MAGDVVAVVFGSGITLPFSLDYFSPVLLAYSGGGVGGKTVYYYDFICYSLQ